MTAPTIPPRPSRAQNSAASGSANMDLPKIPPRPAKRSVDRSVSPNRDAFARSPLNDPSFHHNGQHHHKNSPLSPDLPPRPPSVTLPSIGQEGAEYASFEDLSRTVSREEQTGSPHHTKNVSGDLPLHAPKASLASSTAKSRIQTVTRTDSSQAAAHGLGKLPSEDRAHLGPESVRSGSSAGNRTRPGSVHREKDDEHEGIPWIGVQVPMYPNAGDVQAPTPSPYEQHGSPSLGFTQKPSGRRHERTKSGREIFHGPPGSYGLHGHGVIPKDEFQQQWYAKHPEDLKREKAGEYGHHVRVERKDYHWVGDDLVKLVHSSASTGTGVGTSRDAIGTPDEQIGYLATEEYASRMASPRPHSGRPASISGKSGVHADSPLRHENGPEDQLTRTTTHESDADPDVIHIDPPTHRHSSKIGGGEHDAPAEDHASGHGHADEEGHYGYGVPILAADEIEKHPEAEWRQPAVTPEIEQHRSSVEFTLNDADGQPIYMPKSRSHSRSSSRNNNKMSRFASSNENVDRTGTPLESTKEYEPLFPEDEEDEEAQRPKSAVDRLKRPDLARHHFPSQDVWEDTPSSLQLETTVETPQGPDDTEDQYEEQTPGNVDAGTVFEKPQAEEARKNNITEEDKTSFLPEHTRRFANKHLNQDHLNDGRPGMQQRFPSHDVWEDAPDHGHLVTTVNAPQTDDTNVWAEDSPVTEKPSGVDRPDIPARPQKESSPVDKKAPAIPERPKPSVPARPSRPSAKSSEKTATLESHTSEAPQPKAKPPVPARPAGSKIAALQAGFLQDLNSKLGLGPQAPKPKEPEPEKEEEAPKPLQDARKGRAKGPQRKKPSSSPSPAVATITAEVAVPRRKLEIATVTTLWNIGDDGQLDVPASRIAQKIQSALKAPEKAEEPAKSEVPESSEEPEQATESEKRDESVKPEEQEEKPGLAARMLGTITAALKSPEQPEESDQAEKPDSEDAKDVEEQATASEETELAKAPTNTSSKSDAAPEVESEALPDLDAQGGVQLDNKLSVEGTQEASVPTPTVPPLGSDAFKPGRLDLDLYEEGKDAERMELGI